jgi:hypothetical protein
MKLFIVYFSPINVSLSLLSQNVIFISSIIYMYIRILGVFFSWSEKSYFTPIQNNRHDFLVPCVIIFRS